MSKNALTEGFVFSTPVMIILGAIIALAVLAILFAFFKDVILAVFSKTITTHAKLTSKYEQDYVTQRIYASGSVGTGSVAQGVAEKGKEYFFSFQLDNGKFVTLLVPKDIYDVALEEGSGTLTYKGKRFISYDGPTDGTRLRTDAQSNTFVGLDRDHI